MDDEGADVDGIDFFRDETVVADPYPYFDALRSRCPVYREPHHGVYMVTGYEEAHAVYGDPATFSSCNSVSGPFPGFPVPLRGDDVGELIEKHRGELPMSDQLPTLDPPVHRAHRGLLMKLLTPKRLRENEEFMWRLVDRRLDEFLSRGRCELVGELAGPFTFHIIADLLGIPEADQAALRQDMQGGGRKDRRQMGSTGEGETLARHPLEFLYDRIGRYIEDRRRHPRADLLTEIAQARFPDGSVPEVIDTARVAANLFSAGQETTVRLLASAFHILAEDGDLQSRLRGRPELVTAFVEECLRLESPVKGDFRLSRVPTTVGGVTIPAGETVMVLNGDANRDPGRFDQPEAFRVDRSNAREHLAFGRGIHACPGGPLARSEARVAIQRFLERALDIRISEEHHGPPGHRSFRYVPTFMLRGLTRLHLEFVPAG